jgi:hypothetical protein
MTKTKWGGNEPTITLEQYARLMEVKAIRQSAPSYSSLAREWGVSVHAVLDAASRGIKRYDYQLRQRNLATPK